MFGSEDSAFWFYGRLGPAYLVPPFNVSSIEVEEGATLEIAWEGIGLWSPVGTRLYKQPGDVSALLRTVAGAWAAVYGRSLTVTLEGWIEATRAAFDASIMGWVNPRPGAAALADPGSELSQAMERASRLAVRAHGLSGYRLALRDIHSAYADNGPEAFVYAFRALEDAARAVSGTDRRVNGGDWRAFHEHLGVDPRQAGADLEDLTKARHAVVHGVPDDPAVRRAEARREDILLDARRRVLRALARDARIDVEIDALLPANDPWAEAPGT